MKHLKKFENFDPIPEEDQFTEVNHLDNEDCEDCDENEEDCEPCEEEDEKDWNDEENLTVEKISSFEAFNEKKASPAQLAARKAFADRIKGKKSDKKDDKKDDKKEDKDDKKEDKVESKGLSAKQKNLPAALQASILKRQKK